MSRQCNTELMAAYDGLAGSHLSRLISTQFDARKKENEIAIALAQSTPATQPCKRNWRRPIYV